MDQKRLTKLLDDFKTGEATREKVLATLKSLPFEDLGFAKIDHHRSIRSGFPEVVFCEGKSIEQIKDIFKTLREHNPRLLLTRADPEVFKALHEIDERLIYNELGRIISLDAEGSAQAGFVPVICAGTADTPVAEEALVTAKICGARTERIYDVGVAGIHRLLEHVPTIQKASCIVCIAGMEGALPSVVGGIAPCQVIAVPTSIGYGTHLNGLVPLFGMLNSCSSTVSVVNIDNGFSAGYIAAMSSKQSS